MYSLLQVKGVGKVKGDDFTPFVAYVIGVNTPVSSSVLLCSHYVQCDKCVYYHCQYDED